MTTPTSAGQKTEPATDTADRSHHPTRRQRWRSLRERAPIVGMMTPAIVIFAVLMILPMVMTFGLSFTPSGFVPTWEWIGLENYQRVFTSAQARRSLSITVLFAVVTTTALNVLGLAFAHALNHPGRVTIIYRAIVFFPIVLSQIVVGFLWRDLLSRRGSINAVLDILGFDPFPFLARPTSALASLMFVSVWQALGFTMVLYLVALQAIPKDMQEACLIDGASPWQRFRFLTLPMIAPAITVNVMALLIWGMREYDRVKALTDGGPARATETAAVFIVDEALSRSRLGFSQAMAVILLLLVGVTAALLTRWFHRNEQKVMM